MIFIHDVFTGQFQVMIHPIYMELDKENPCILYIQDSFGKFYTLTFTSRAVLDEAVKAMRYSDSINVRCYIDMREREMVDGYGDEEREIDLNTLDDHDYYGREF